MDTGIHWGFSSIASVFDQERWKIDCLVDLESTRSKIEVLWRLIDGWKVCVLLVQKAHPRNLQHCNCPWHID